MSSSSSIVASSVLLLLLLLLRPPLRSSSSASSISFLLLLLLLWWWKRLSRLLVGGRAPWLLIMCTCRLTMSVKARLHSEQMWPCCCSLLSLSSSLSLCSRLLFSPCCISNRLNSPIWGGRWGGGGGKSPMEGKRFMRPPPPPPISRIGEPSSLSPCALAMCTLRKYRLDTSFLQTSQLTLLPPPLLLLLCPPPPPPPPAV